MAKSIIGAGAFNPSLSKAETKSQRTDSVARTIVEAEATARDKKTAKLRAARLAKEALDRDALPEKPVGKPATGGRARAAKA
jgi:hypothetical protein